MKEIVLACIFLQLIIGLTFCDPEPSRVKRWGHYGNWNGPGGNYGNNNNYGPPPNNNVAIGYPTAYGLGGFGVRGNGESGPNPPPKFVVRCMNGGAHIGQCRLDEDAICIALGGTCINSQCCTTPFYGLITTSTSTTQQPLIIDGDAFRPKMHSFSSEEEEEREPKERNSNKSEEEEGEEVEVTTPTESPDEEEGQEDEKLKEIDELSKLLEFGKRNGLSTDSPIYAVFAGLFGITTSPSGSSSLPAPESIHVIPEFPKPEISTEAPIESTKMPTTKNAISVTTATPVNSMEKSSSSEEIIGEEDYTRKQCQDGSKPIGPCNDDNSCPIDHSCQKGSICCFNFSATFLLQH